MKLSALLTTSSALTAVFAAPAADLNSNNSDGSLRKRQSLDGQLGLLTGAVGMLPELKPFKTEEVPPQSGRAGAKRIKIYYGPFKMLGANVKKETTGPLAAMSLDPNSNSWNNKAMGIPLNATYLYVNALLQFEDGNPATTNSGIYNHHLAYVSTKKFVPQFMSCAGKSAVMKTPSTFMGSTEEANYSIYTTPDYKFDSGYYLGPDDKIVVTGEIVNYNNETKNVFAVSELEYIPGRVEGFKDVVTQILQVNQCDSNQLALEAPKNKKVYSLDSKNLTALQDGYIMNGRAHMHDGGIGILMYVNGKVACSSEAIYGGPQGTRKGDDGKVWETMSGVKPCIGPVEVKKGDTVTLKAKYDLEKHPPRQHAGSDMSHGMAEEMALLSFAFATKV